MIIIPKKKKLQIITRTLSAEDIDEASDDIVHFLESIGSEKENIIRIRLSLEDMLLRWQEVFDENTEVSFGYGVQWSRTRITIQLRGKEFDPTISHGGEDELWQESPLVGIGLLPQYSYRNGVNCLDLDLASVNQHPIFNVLWPLAAGACFGVFGRLFLPREFLDAAMDISVEPMRTAFYSVMNMAASPIIFLSILWSICGLSDGSKAGMSHRKTILFMMTDITVMTVAALLIGMFLFDVKLWWSVSAKAEFSAVLGTLLDLIPTDILSPIIAARSDQLIILGLILGNGLLALGSKANRVIGFVGEMNNLGELMTNWVSRITPFFVCFVVTVTFWSRSEQVFLQMLVPLLTFVIMMAVLMAVYIGIISLRVKSTFLTLWHKIKPSFIVAMKNASVGAAYGANESCCVRKLGIPTPTVMYVLPRGLAIYMPASIFEMAFFALYLVSADEMQITLSWLLKALIMTVAVVVATPPVTGIGVLNFLCLLTALNISQESLIAFLVVDTVLGFVIYPVNQALLQLHLIRVAIRRGELQTKIIQC